MVLDINPLVRRFLLMISLVANAFGHPGVGPIRQAIKNGRHSGCDRRIPPAIEKAPVIMAIETAPVIVAIETAPAIVGDEVVVVAHCSECRPLAEIRERRRLTELAVARARKPLRCLEFAPQARFAALHLAISLCSPSPPKNRSSTAEYLDAVEKIRPGVALSPPRPKKMEAEPVDDEKPKVGVARGLFARVRKLFFGK